LGAAAATVAIVGVWLFTRAVGAGLAWEAALWCVLLALTFHVFVEWEREPGAQGSPAPAAIVASLGLFVLLIVASASTSMAEPWPWLAGSAGLAALLLRPPTLPPRAFPHPVAAPGMGAPLPPLWLFHGTTLALGVLVALSATRLGSGPGVLGAALATALVQWGWTWALRGPGEITPLLLQGAAVLLFTAWPFLAGARFR